MSKRGSSPSTTAVSNNQQQVGRANVGGPPARESNLAASLQQKTENNPTTTIPDDELFPKKPMETVDDSYDDCSVSKDKGENSPPWEDDSAVLMVPTNIDNRPQQRQHPRSVFSVGVANVDGGTLPPSSTGAVIAPTSIGNRPPQQQQHDPRISVLQDRINALEKELDSCKADLKDSNSKVKGQWTIIEDRDKTIQSLKAKVEEVDEGYQKELEKLSRMIKDLKATVGPGVTLAEVKTAVEALDYQAALALFQPPVFGSDSGEN
jgi:hypothetical protein